jgi:predicted GNAT family acetyltransferase
MTSGKPEPVVRDVPERHRYEVAIDGTVVGFLSYRDTPGALIFTHAEVHPAHGGRGIGNALARAALDDARRRGRTVVPRCAFVADVIERNPEYRDLVG